MKRTTVGLISDTHGKIDPAVYKLFSGVDTILHAGDWGDYRLVSDLQSIAPVYGVQGNVDERSKHMPAVTTAKVGGIRIHIEHRIDPTLQIMRHFVRHKRDSGSRVDLALFGHTHSVFIEEIDGVLFVNPGSATKPRESGTRTAGLLSIADRRITAITIHDLQEPELPVIAEWRPTRMP